jgi:hypothetical protein
LKGKILGRNITWKKKKMKLREIGCGMDETGFYATAVCRMFEPFYQRVRQLVISRLDQNSVILPTSVGDGFIFSVQILFMQSDIRRYRRILLKTAESEASLIFTLA